MELAPFASLASARQSRQGQNLRCPQCRGPVQPGTPFVQVSASGVLLYCSAACRDAAQAPWAVPVPEVEPRPAHHSRLGRLFAIGVGLASMSPCSHTAGGRLTGVAPGHIRAASTGVDRPAAPLYGPPSADAPDDQERAQEFLAKISDDRWIHPLAGPTRRMPIRQSRAFGATREGDRPFECRSGHCGVDLGGQMWGEQVFAVHDGVVDRVNRDPSHSGGKYIRLSHRHGTVFSSYFHLAAIPRWLKKGDVVHLGDVVGLLGETGVYHSGPHLHFAMSVKPTPDSAEIYIDPEPLIALWPLKVPEGSGVVAAAGWTPGVPVGAAGRLHGHRRHSTRPAGRRHHRHRSRTKEPAQLSDGPAQPAAAPPGPAAGDGGGGGGGGSVASPPTATAASAPRAVQAISAPGGRRAATQGSPPAPITRSR